MTKQTKQNQSKEKKMWGKEIHIGRLHMLITNHLRLGLKVKMLKRYGEKVILINLISCQIEIDL